MLADLGCGLLALGCSASAGGGALGGGTAGAPTTAAGGTGGTPAGSEAGGTGAPPPSAAGGGGAPGSAGAAQGGSAVGGGAGMGSAPAPLPTYDPNVHFEWTETVPGTVACEPGHYVGTFDGFYNTLIPVAGDIDMTLSQSQNGEFLEVSDGEMSGVANLTIPFSATVQGSLDCQGEHFDAQLIDGTYDAFGNVSSFEGPLVADYDTSTHKMISGTWTVTEPNGTSGGTGTWEATWTP